MACSFSLSLSLLPLRGPRDPSGSGSTGQDRWFECVWGGGGGGAPITSTTVTECSVVLVTLSCMPILQISSLEPQCEEAIAIIAMAMGV